MSFFASVTYSEAAKSNNNMLVESHWPRQKHEFMAYLQRETRALEQVVIHHLSLSSHEACTVSPARCWKFGSFNVVIPVMVNNSYEVAVRCPWPHRMHSPTSPDIAGEKIRGEAATYAWVSSHCPNVPIPKFLGFGLSNGLSFTPLVRCSWIRRAYEWLRQRIQRAFFDVEYWRPFAPSSSPVILRTGYLITELIGPHQGKMLRKQWPIQTVDHLNTLYRSLARVLLDLIKIPLPRIGSFTVHDSGQVTLGGRPLTAPLAMLEGGGIPSDIAPTTTYTSVDAYLEDLLHCHDTRMRWQPNAVESPLDAEAQLASIVVWKAIRSQFVDRNVQHGPFALQFTDLSKSNIFVDRNYNITAIVDLEWTCSLPLEMLQPPFWISGNTQWDFVGKGKPLAATEATFIVAGRLFLDILSEEQESRSSSQQPAFDAESVIRGAFEKKSHWYFTGLKYPGVTYAYLIHHIQRMLSSRAAPRFPHYELAHYYMKDITQFINQKVTEKAQYDESLRQLFKEERAAGSAVTLV
jgi:hypothetical protein